MKITYVSSFNTYNKTNSPRPSFGSAADITLEYIKKNRFYLLPERVQQSVIKKIASNEKIQSLKALHEEIYRPLLSCKSLEEAQNLFPEFREVLQADTVIQRLCANFRQINQRVLLKDLSLYLLKERWANLKTIDEIAMQLGLKSRSSLTWLIDKIRIPALGKNYQNLLKASDEGLNKEISQKVKAYNAQNREKVLAHNRKLSYDPRCIALNRDLSLQMWNNMPNVKKAMSDFRKENPYLRKGFYRAFWDKHPELKAEVSRVRKELGEQRRSNKK